MGEKKKFLLRINDSVYQSLEKWAADNFRSVNAQIEFLLIESLKKNGRAPADKTTSAESNTNEGSQSTGSEG